MKNVITILIVLISVLVSLHSAEAGVGVGTSPSKIVLQVQSGQETTIEILVFNPGDENIKVSMDVEGDIAPFTEFNEEILEVDPEPKPHALPIRNGKTVQITFKPPASTQTRTYTGTISATGGPGEGTQFGGSVGVATLVTLIATPPPSVLSFITKRHIIIAATIIIIIIMLVILRKKGLRLTFQQQE